MGRLLAAGLFAALAGCTAGPDFRAPAPPSPEAGYAADGGADAALGEGPAATWWTAFGSPELDALVARALADNPGLAASIATLERARAQMSAVAGRRLPQIDANARADYQKFNLGAFGLGDRIGAQAGNPTFDLYSLGGSVSYNLDLAGGNRRALEQAGALAEAEQRRTEAAHLLIAGRVVGQVLAIAALNDRIETLATLLAEGERNVALTEARRRAGAGTMVEVLSAQGQLAGDRAALPRLEQQLVEGRAMLALLTGVSPAELGPTRFRLRQFTLPAPVPVAIPSALVRTRPDIRESEARLHAAIAAIGVAEARLYPDVTIGGSLTQQTSQPGKLFSPGSNAFDLFAGLTAPIFHGGTLKAERRAAEAEARAAAANHREVVLEAFGQVSNLLSALETDARTLAIEEEAARIAERSLTLSRRSFQVGNSGILQVLDASRNHQRARLALVDARARQYLDVARLYGATAGGIAPLSNGRERPASAGD